MKYVKNIKEQKFKGLKTEQIFFQKIKLPLKKIKILKLVPFIFIYLFLFINIKESQNLPLLYLQVISKKKEAIVDFLKKIRALNYFPQELEKYKKIYGKKIDEEVFAQERERKQMIKNLEQILEKNPKARDVFYSLYWLYKEEDNKKKATEYLRKAKELDPEIK